MKCIRCKSTEELTTWRTGHLYCPKCYKIREKKWEIARKKSIREVNGFYSKTEQSAKTHMTKMKGIYL